nr:NYN domain-containing protein [Sinorhizobium fredii]
MTAPSGPDRCGQHVGQDRRWVVRRSCQARRGERPTHLREFLRHTIESLGGCAGQTRYHPQQQFAYTTGKNASDITLVIDAMDLLHSGRFDGFCLVSSDSDFTRLAARISE